MLHSVYSQIIKLRFEWVCYVCLVIITITVLLTLWQKIKILLNILALFGSIIVLLLANEDLLTIQNQVLYCLHNSAPRLLTTDVSHLHLHAFPMHMLHSQIKSVRWMPGLSIFHPCLEAAFSNKSLVWCLL